MGCGGCVRRPPHSDSGRAPFSGPAYFGPDLKIPAPGPDGPISSLRAGWQPPSGSLDAAGPPAPRPPVGCPSRHLRYSGVDPLGRQSHP